MNKNNRIKIKCKNNKVNRKQNNKNIKNRNKKYKKLWDAYNLLSQRLQIWKIITLILKNLGNGWIEFYKNSMTIVRKDVLVNHL
jgi:hypothetical protein